ncbi:hypothetical protein BGZ92_008417 [Podila epicladia]|nr:hypothetical protein BGZ92_008417 [Podila epicladia]
MHQHLSLKEDPLVTLMGQLQSMSLTNTEPIAHVDQDASHRSQWNEFVQRVQHVNLHRAQIKAQKPLLDPTEFRDMVTQYAFTSCAVQPPWSFVSKSLTGSWMDSCFETEIWELIYSNGLRQINDMILLSEIMEAEGERSTITREDLISRREAAIENSRRHQEDRRKRLEGKNRIRLLEEELRLIEEERRLLDEEERLLDEEWRRQVEEDHLEEDQLVEHEDRQILQGIRGMDLQKK